MSQHEENHGFLDKLKKPFRSHSRSSSSVKSDDTHELSTHDKQIIESAYIEGQRKAERETGKKVDSYGFIGGSKSKHDIVQQAYLEGKNFFHREKHQKTENSSSHGHGSHEGTTGTGHEGITHGAGPGVVASSSVGRVLTSPPSVKRQPVEKDKGGDFANEKQPIHDTVVIDPGSKGLHKNANPAYADDANVSKGAGYFFDPKDTQGGGYRDYRGDHIEATEAKLDKNRNLKTVPLAYQEQEEQEKHEEEIKDQVYLKGKKQGTEEVKDQPEDSLNQPSLTLQDKNESNVDSSEEHDKNRSAYNTSGISTATDDARNQGKPTQNSKDNDRDYGKYGAGTAAGVAGIAAGTAYARHNKDDKEVTSHSGSHTGTGIPTSDKGATTANTSANKDYVSPNIPPSSKDFDYNNELKKLDNQIANTQSEIDHLQGATTKPSTASTIGVLNEPIDSSTHEKSKSLDPKIHGKAVPIEGTGAGHSSGHGGADSSGHSGAGIAGAAGLSGVVAAAAGYIGLHNSTHDESKVHDQSKVHDAYSEGVKQGAYDSGNKLGELNSRSVNPSNIESSGFNSHSTGNPTDAAYKSGVESGAYDAGSKNAHSGNAPTSARSGGILSAASAFTTSALGMDSGEELTSGSDYNRPSGKVTDKRNTDSSSKPSKLGGATVLAGHQVSSGSNDKSVIDDAYESGKNKAINEHELNKSKKHDSKIAAPVLQDVDDQLNDDTSSHSGSAVGGISSGKKSTKSGAATTGDSLVDSAVRVSDEVAKKPVHHSKAGVLETNGTPGNTDGVQEVSGLASHSPPEEDTKSKSLPTSTSKTSEADAIEYNRKHGFTDDKRSLIEIAEGESPEIKNISPHKGGKVLDETEKEQTTDGVQKIPTSAFKNQNEFIRTGGRSGSLNDPATSSETGAVGHSNKASFSDPNMSRKPPVGVASIPSHRSDNVSARDNSGGKTHTDHHDPVITGKKDTESYPESESGNKELGYGAVAIGAGAAAVGAAMSYFSSGKPNEQSRETGAGVVTTDLNDKHGLSSGIESNTSNDASKIKQEAYEAGNLLAAKDLSLEQDKNKKLLEPQASSKSGLEHSTKNIEGYEVPGAGAAALGLGGIAATGTKLSSSSTSDHSRNHLTEKEQSELYNAGVQQSGYKGGAVGGAKEQYKTQSTSGDKSSKDGDLVVEVIGVTDKDLASKIAYQATKDMNHKGVDLSSGKLVVNANTKEVYKTDLESKEKDLGSSTGEKSTTGTGTKPSGHSGPPTGVGAASAGLSGSQPSEHSNKHVDVIPPRVDLTSQDPSQPQHYHHQHQTVKERLSRAANEGLLGNITNDPSGHPVHGEPGSHDPSSYDSQTNSTKGLGAGFGGVDAGAKEKQQKSDVLVNVQGIQDSKQATKIASKAVEKIQESNPEALSNVQSLNIDSKSGVVTDEKGHVLLSQSNQQRSEAGSSGISGLGSDAKAYSRIPESGGLSVTGGAQDSSYGLGSTSEPSRSQVPRSTVEGAPEISSQDNQSKGQAGVQMPGSFIY